MTQKVPGVATEPRVLRRWPGLAAAAVIVALLGAASYVWYAGFAPRLPGASVAEDKLATAPRLSSVVLPFENLSGDKEQGYFVDGITDDLTTDLSHLPDSFVISRGTAFTYKGKPVDPKEIGKELAVSSGNGDHRSRRRRRLSRRIATTPTLSRPRASKRCFSAAARTASRASKRRFA